MTRRSIQGVFLCLFISGCTQSYYYYDSIPQNDRYLRSKFPLQKSWDELTDQEKQAVRDQYTDLSPDDEPPFPKNGLGPISDAMKIERNFSAKGQLVLAVFVDAEGKAQRISVFETPDEKMAKAAAAALMKGEYKPAKCRGVPCPMAFLFRYNFVPAQ